MLFYLVPGGFFDLLRQVEFKFEKICNWDLENLQEKLENISCSNSNSNSNLYLFIFDSNHDEIHSDLANLLDTLGNLSIDSKT